MTKTRRSSSVVLLVFLAVVMLGCGQQPAQQPDTRAADEAAIRALTKEWAQAAAAKDLDKAVSYYAADAVVFPPNAGRAGTPEERRKVWEGMLGADTALTFSTTGVEVAHHGDLAYETGIYSVTTTDKRGKEKTEMGKYVVVWKKQADGSWKAAVDTWNADQ